MTTKAATKPKRVTPAQLKRYQTLQREASDLGRRMRAALAEAALIKALAVTDLKASGRATISRGGWRVELVDDGKVAIKWKDAYVDACGAEAAAKLAEDAPAKQKLTVTPPPEK